MQPDNVEAILAVGDNFEDVLFQTAISLAQNGLHIWFIAPEKLQKTPKNIKPPAKEILQLITFIYSKGRDNLIAQLHGTHQWHKTPHIIILSKFEDYCNLHDCNLLEVAQIAASLLDSASVCAKKHKKKVFLLVACIQENKGIKSVQTLKDLYFPRVIHKCNDNKFLKEVLEIILPEI